MKLTTLFLSTVLAVMSIQAQSWQPMAEATIEIRTSEKVGPAITRRLFGKFTEHLGRNVYRGAWAQLLENPGFEPETKWGNTARLRTFLQLAEIAAVMPGLAEAPDSGVAPWWAPVSGNTTAFKLLSGGINGSFQLLTTNAPNAGIRTFIFPPIDRTRSYQLSLWVRNPNPTVNVLTISLHKPVDTTPMVEISYNLPTNQWQKLQTTFEIPDTVTLNRGEVLHLWLTLVQPGTVWLDQCLIFPADHLDGWDPEIVAYLRAAHLPLLRFPGGNFVSGYHWQDGIGPLDDRPARPNPAWFGIEWNHVGTDEWLRLCELVGVQPLICLNAGNGTAQEAARWLEYCNGDTTTPMGALRAANGHPQPYQVKLWEIGNELYGSWQIGHTDATGYAERYARFHTAMSAVDPTVSFIANGFDEAWNRTVVQRNPATIRSFSVHTLPGYDIPATADAKEVYLELMAYLQWYPTELARFAKPLVELGIPPKLAITELQIFTKKSELPNNQTLSEALWVAGIYNLAIRSKGAIELITHSALVNHGGGLRKEYFNVVYPNPVWWTTHLYSTQLGTQPVAVQITSPTFSTAGKWFPKAENVPYLDAVALVDSTEDTLILLVTNRHPDSALVSTIRLQDFRPEAVAAVFTLTGSSFMAQNTSDHPNAVHIVESLTAADTTFDYVFPAVSLTMLQIGRQGTSTVKGSRAPVLEFRLEQNYPNPFNPATTIRFSLPHREQVSLKVFDILGREVATLVDEELNPGEHSAVFNAEQLPNSVYVYRLTAGRFVQQRTMVVVK